jgi:hypothetical protein
MDPRDRPAYPTLTPADMIGKQTGKVQPKPTPCPFGCTEHSEGVNQHGYCPHLIGWSADGQTYERRERVVNTDVEICRGPHRIDKDKHVCVEVQSGLRVYDRKGRAPVLIARPVVEAPEVEEPYEDADLEELTRPVAAV